MAKVQIVFLMIGLINQVVARISLLGREILSDKNNTVVENENGDILVKIASGET